MRKRYNRHTRKFAEDSEHRQQLTWQCQLDRMNEHQNKVLVKVAPRLFEVFKSSSNAEAASDLCQVKQRRMPS